MIVLAAASALAYARRRSFAGAVVGAGGRCAARCAAAGAVAADRRRRLRTERGASPATWSSTSCSAWSRRCCWHCRLRSRSPCRRRRRGCVRGIRRAQCTAGRSRLAEPSSRRSRGLRRLADRCCTSRRCSSCRRATTPSTSRSTLICMAAGALFMWPLVGVDPIPGRVPFGARILTVMAAVPFHAFLGLALISTTTALAPGVVPVARRSAPRRRTAVDVGRADVVPPRRTGDSRLDRRRRTSGEPSRCNDHCP